MIPTDEILQLAERISIGIEIGESHFREFKSACSRNANNEITPRSFKEICRDIGDTLVSFANADGGELFLGVEDDGTITGVPHKEDLVTSMKTSYPEYIHRDTPLPTPRIGDNVIEGKRVIYFSVSKSTDKILQTSDGRCLQRFDRVNRPVAIEKIIVAREETSSREYDRGFVDGMTAADLDVELLTHVSERITRGFSPEKLLQYLGVAEFGESVVRYRRAAALLFAKDISKWHPRCAVRIVRVRGTELGVGENYNVTQDDQIVGPVPLLIEEAWESLRPHLARTRFEATGLFRESLIYPESACREALVNAVAHRDYSREGSAIEITVYDNRMEFRSPGGLLSTVSIEQLTSLSRVHETRNVLIARTLRELGHMREMGEGIFRMFGAMRDSELVDPELNADTEYFGVTLRYQSIFNRQDIEWLNSYREFDLEKNEQRVVLLGRGGNQLSTNDIIRVAGIVDIDDFRALYEQLRRKGIVYSTRSRSATGGRRRETGRFRVRPSSEAELFLGELIEALKSIGQTMVLTRELTVTVRNKLSLGNPYRDHPDHSLQALGFIDSQKRILPKALSFVPELNQSVLPSPRRLQGYIKAAKPGRYGFICDNAGDDFFFHQSYFRSPVDWKEIKANSRVSFVSGPPKAPGLLETASDIEIL